MQIFDMRLKRLIEFCIRKEHNLILYGHRKTGQLIFWFCMGYDCNFVYKNVCFNRSSFFSVHEYCSLMSFHLQFLKILSGTRHLNLSNLCEQQNSRLRWNINIFNTNGVFYFSSYNTLVRTVNTHYFSELNYVVILVHILSLNLMCILVKNLKCC